ncbi:MAG: DUF4384 domain-containing protein [Candidatus Riflebacteria bacterium]|nr:DUF4384 domain-containing protein [Candidatus Riflebacteria bacterium]
MIARTLSVTALLVMFAVDATAADIGKELRLVTPPSEPPALVAPATKLELTAWTNRESGHAKVGDDLEIVLRASSDSYVYVIDVGTSGGADLIFPNRKAPDNKVLAGKTTTVPERGVYTVRVDGNPGQEYLVILASPKPLPVWDNLHLLAPRRTPAALGLGGDPGKVLSVSSTGCRRFLTMRPWRSAPDHGRLRRTT